MKQKIIILRSKIVHWVSKNFLGFPYIFFGSLNTNKQTKTKPAFVSLLLKLWCHSRAVTCYWFCQGPKKVSFCPTKGQQFFVWAMSSNRFESFSNTSLFQSKSMITHCYRLNNHQNTQLFNWLTVSMTKLQLAVAHCLNKQIKSVALVAQWVESWLSELFGRGSNPVLFIQIFDILCRSKNQLQDVK